MRYIDGFVLTVKKKELKTYKKMATGAGKIWMKHGALEYAECMGEDLKKQAWMGMTFQSMTKPKKDEVIFFSFITYKSRKHRDQVNARVMKDPGMHPEKYKDVPMPFNMKKMAYGGFEAIVDL